MHTASSQPFKYAKFGQGFTIVELLIVVVVIAILAAITIVSYSGIAKNANNAAMQSTLSQAAKKLEIFKMNDTSGVFPATLAGAGLTLVNDSTTTYVYAVSSDSAAYCLSSSKSGRTYYVASTAPKPQPGICNGTAATPGTGDVAVDGGSTAPVTASRYSIYDGQAPGTSQVVGTDGGGSFKYGNRFYTYMTAGIKVVGMRIYNPASSNGGFLNLSLTAYAYMNDWKGVGVPNATTFSSSPSATKVYNSPRLAGAWTDILFDTPITLPKITSAATGNDLLTLSVMFTGGNHYVSVTPNPSDGTPINSTVQPGTYISEHSNINRGVSTTGEGGYLYGIDLLFETITP